MDRSLNVPGLPELTGRLNLEGRARVQELERIANKIHDEDLLFALAEREQQLAVLMEKLRERS